MPTPTRATTPAATDATTPAATDDPMPGPGALRRSLATPGAFATVVELVPWAGELSDTRGQKPLRMASDLAGDPRITALSVTDNAGGHARLSPDTPGEALQALGHDVVVHVAARDRNRNGLQSLGWDLLSRGLTTVLAISGDYPVDGFEGLAKPVFDLDSVALLALLRELGAAAAERAASDGAPDSPSRDFLLGCAVDPFKRLERDLVPQLLKLALKTRTGADFVITQVGYDARKQDELLRWMRGEGIERPVVANAYILSAGVARAFHAGRVPGCVVTDELLALAERQASSPDKGRAFFLELAAKQAIVARGMGFAGVYLSGHRDADEVRRVGELVDAHGDADWRPLVRDVSFGQPGAFHLFAPDGAGLSTDEPSRAYRASLAPGARSRARARVSPFYRVNRVAHERVFEPGTPGFRAWARVYGAVERAARRTAAPRPRAGGQGAAVRLPGLRRLLAPRHRLPVPREPLREEPAQRAVRRRARRPLRDRRPSVHLGRGLPAAQALRGGAGDARPAARDPGQPPAAHERLGQHVPRTRPPRRAPRRRHHPERIRFVRPDRTGTPFLVVGENIHATRVVKRAGRLAAELEDGTVGIAFEDAHGERRILPVHPDLVTGRDFAAGKIKHVASAIRWGLDGDRHAELAAAYIRSMAARQEAAGADWLDLNADEVAPASEVRAAAMAWLVGVVEATRIGSRLDRLVGRRRCSRPAWRRRPSPEARSS